MNAPSKPENEDETSDAELVVRCQQGDLGAFDTLITRHRQKAFSMIYQIVRNEHDAWDLTQDGFVRAWKALPRFQGNAAFYTWLYRIMTNVAIDSLRQRQRRNEADFDETIAPDSSPGSLPNFGPDPGTELERQELKERIEAAIEKLSPDHRAVIIFKEMEGLQYHEIAESIGCSIGTVMSRLFHARRNLQRMLADVYEKL